MTSSFTGNKGFEQPAAGDYVNAWAPVVNSNWTAIDAALGGTTSISVTGISAPTTTLTLAQYRPPNIEFTGTLGVNLNYQIPTGVGGMWSINNATSGAFSLSFSIAAGNSLTLAPGRTLIISDGAAVGLADTVRQLFAPATAAENSALITPVSFAYDRPYIERQGAQANPPNQTVLANDAITAVNNAIVVNTRQIRSYDSDFLVSAALINPNGIEFEGTGALLTPDPNGGYHQLNSYGDLSKYFFGKEYLYRVYQRLIVGGVFPITAFAYGDSTVQGGNGESVSFDVQNLLPFLCKVKGLQLPMAVTNRGVAGTKITDMNALPDLANTTDLFIIKYGINDGLNPLTTRLSTFATGLRGQLAAIRAATFGNLASLSIVLVGPNSTNDSPDGRDERWYEQLRGVYARAARDYNCMYFDTYAYLLDSRPAAGLWLDNVIGGGIGIHPQNNACAWIWGALIDAMFGQSESAVWRGNHSINTSGIFDLPTMAGPPSAYQFGTTVQRAFAASGGWPEDGAVVTIRQLDGVTLQMLFPFAAGRTVVPKRVANISGNSWNLWTGQVNAVALLNGWVTFAGGFDTPKAVLGDDNVVTVSMTIKSGTPAAGTVLATLPAGMFPAATVGPFPAVDSTGKSTVSVWVDNAGNITANTALDVTSTSVQFSFRAL